MTTVDHPTTDVDPHHHLIKMHQPETAKNIHVYLNGDDHFPGRKFVVNRRHISDFDGFLNQVTMGMKAPFGAVRRIYTPHAGHRVNDLNQLQTGMHVVASGVGKFRKLEYGEIGARQRNHPPRRNYLDIKISSYRKPVSARWRKYIKDPCQIYVYGNGDFLAPALKLLLIPRCMKTWDLVLNEITEKISIRTGQAVRKLFDMDFHLLTNPSELVNGHYYIAVGPEKLKKYPYGEIHNKSPPLRKQLQPLPPIKRKPITHKAEDDNTYTKMYVQKKQSRAAHVEETTVMGASAATGYKPLKVRKYRTFKPSSSEPDEETVFPPKPVKVKRASGTSVTVAHEMHPPTNDEEDGVYKTGGQSVTADTVDEDENTKVDLPIDQTPAGEVHEEEVTSHRSDDVVERNERMSPTPRGEGDASSAREDPDEVRTPSIRSLSDRSEKNKSPEPEPVEDESSAVETSADVLLVAAGTGSLLQESQEEKTETPEEEILNDEKEQNTGDDDAVPKEDDETDAPNEKDKQEESAEVDPAEDEELTGIEGAEVAEAAEPDKNESIAEETLDARPDDVAQGEIDGVGDEEKPDLEESAEIADENTITNEVEEDENAESAPNQPDDEVAATNRSITPSSPRPNEEESNPEAEDVSSERLGNDASLDDTPVEDKTGDDDLSSLPNDDDTNPPQDSVEVSEPNGGIPARPASDALTEDDQAELPSTPASKKTLPNGDVAASAEISPS